MHRRRRSDKIPPISSTASNTLESNPTVTDTLHAHTRKPHKSQHQISPWQLHGFSPRHLKGRISPLSAKT
jgi:hypothetical protein